MIKHFFWKFRKLWGRWKWPLNILMTKVLLLVMMLWKCALFPRVACLSGIVQSLGCKPGLSWVNNGRCSQIIAVRKYDNLCFVQLLCPVRWKPHETNQLKLQLSTISCWTSIGESTLENNDCQPVKTLLDLQATFAPQSTEDFEYKNNSCLLKPKTECSFK